jgi:hypothetical protein
MSWTKTIRIFIRASRVSLALVMAMAYLLGSVSFESLHKLVADHPVIEHTQEHEQDPCHITLFHNERAGGCEHSTHLAEVDTCTLCDHSLPVLLALLPEVLATPVFSSDSTVTEIITKSKEGVTIYISGRAPPHT